MENQKIKTEQDRIDYFKSFTLAEELKNLYGHEPPQEDIEIVEKLLTILPEEAVKVLVHFFITFTFCKLEHGYVEITARRWKKQKILTIEQAVRDCMDVAEQLREKDRKKDQEELEQLEAELEYFRGEKNWKDYFIVKTMINDLKANPSFEKRGKTRRAPINADSNTTVPPTV